MKIIVVDDELRALQVFLGEIISEKDVEYRFFDGDVKDICDYVSSTPIDAAFLDVRMPGVDGIELSKKLLAIDPKLKIVFITGLSISEEDLPKEVRDQTIGFLYKPYDALTLKRYLSSIEGKKRVLKVVTFDTFDCFIDGKPVKFSSSKSKELFALLIAYNGRSLTMNDAISQLWPDGEVEKSKILYRDAVWRLRRTLNGIDVPCITFGRAVLTLDKSLISCDYWNFLLTGKGLYRGEFCKSYDWSVDYLAELDALSEAS